MEFVHLLLQTGTLTTERQAVCPADAVADFPVWEHTGKSPADAVVASGDGYTGAKRRRGHAPIPLVQLELEVCRVGPKACCSTGEPGSSQRCGVCGKLRAFDPRRRVQTCTGVQGCGACSCSYTYSIPTTDTLTTTSLQPGTTSSADSQRRFRHPTPDRDLGAAWNTDGRLASLLISSLITTTTTEPEQPTSETECSLDTPEWRFNAPDALPDLRTMDHRRNVVELRVRRQSVGEAGRA